MLWVLIAALGLLAVLGAAFMGRGRAAMRKRRVPFGAATAGWE